MSEYHGKTLPEVNFSQNNYFLPLNLFLNPFIASEPITGVQILSGKYWLSRKIITWGKEVLFLLHNKINY